MAEKWAGPYLKKTSDVRDPWNKELNYICPGEHNEDGFDLWSNGPDGEEGTEDDIVNFSPAGLTEYSTLSFLAIITPDLVITSYSIHYTKLYDWLTV